MKLNPKGPWIERFGEDGDVIVSSRARLARNIAGFPFVNQASDEQRTEVLRLARSMPLSDGDDWRWIDLDAHDFPRRACSRPGRPH